MRSARITTTARDDGRGGIAATDVLRARRQMDENRNRSGDADRRQRRVSNPPVRGVTCGQDYTHASEQSVGEPSPTEASSFVEPMVPAVAPTELFTRPLVAPDLRQVVTVVRSAHPFRLYNVVAIGADDLAGCGAVAEKGVRRELQGQGNEQVDQAEPEPQGQSRPVGKSCQTAGNRDPPRF